MRLRVHRQQAHGSPPPRRGTVAPEDIARIAGVVFVDEHNVAIWPTCKLEPVNIVAGITELRLTIDFDLLPDGSDDAAR